MLDDVGALLGNLRWFHQVEKKCVSYDRVVLEFYAAYMLIGLVLIELRRC